MSQIRLTPVDPASISNPATGTYVVFLDSTNNDLLSKKDDAGVITIVGDIDLIIQTAAQWAADTTVYSNKSFLVASDLLYGATDQRQFKIADGVQQARNLDYMPIGSGGGTDLATILALGNTTGGTDIEVSAGDALKIDDATASEIAGFNASKEVVSLAVSTYPSLTELSYVKGVTSAIQTQLNALGVSFCGGRLTLTTATPVMVADVTASTSIFYSLYLNDKVPIYDGTKWTLTTFTELTNTTTDNTKNPAAVGNNSNYDLFVWNDSGTIRLGRGAAWTSDTGRGTGAGTTELERVNGIWVNKIAITNGAAAQRGTYVGTVRSNGTATIDYKLGGVASGGTPSNLHVWNIYNRVEVDVFVGDNDNSWTYTTLTWRAKNNSNNNRISFVRGFDEDGISVINFSFASNSVGGTIGMFAGVGLDATTAKTQMVSRADGAVVDATFATHGAVSIIPGLGFHYVQAIEQGVASGTTTFYGDYSNSANQQTGITFRGKL